MVSMTHGRTDRGAARHGGVRERRSPSARRSRSRRRRTAMCTAGAAAPSRRRAGAPRWSGFGQNPSNTRFQPAAAAGHRRRRRAAAEAEVGVRPARRRAVVGRHHARRTAGCTSAASPATCIRSTRKTGCVHWAYDAGTIVRTAVNVGPRRRRRRRPRRRVLRRRARQHARRGRAHRRSRCGRSASRSFPSARLTGSAVLHDGRLYVPVSSSEEGVGLAARLRVLQVSRQRRGARRRDRPADLEELHHSRGAACRCARTPRGTQLWGPSGAADLVQPRHRRGARRAVCDHRQQLQRSHHARRATRSWRWTWRPAASGGRIR